MTWELGLGLLGTVLALASTVAVAVITSRGNQRAKRQEAESSPYEQLARDVVDLRTRVAALEQDQWTDRRYILDMHEAHPALPVWMPRWLSDRYGLAPTHPPTPGSIIEPARNPEEG